MSGTLRTAGARARLQRLAREAELKTHEAIKRAAEIALAASRALAPGRLPDTLSVRALNQYAFRVSSSSRVAVFQENGTAPHPILPRRNVLVFQVNGATAFARRVQHPGNRAIHFMRHGAEAGKAAMRQMLRDILR